MRNILICNFLVLLLALQACSYSSRKETAELPVQNAIILMHPTVRNVQTLLELIDLSVFPMPSNYQIIGLYHQKGSYNYMTTSKYISDNRVGRVKLISANGSLNAANIYEINDCSQLFDSLFSISKGVIFMGGPDLPPATYESQTNLLTEITDSHRHFLELSFLYHLLGSSRNSNLEPLLEKNTNYLVLGICLGMQSMNVATGGTMLQDIPTQIYGKSTVEEVLAMEPENQHRNYYTNLGLESDLIWGHLHTIQFNNKNSFFSNLAKGSKPAVWSSHHQCIEQLGMGIEPVAWSADGKIVEAVVHSRYPNVLGVQFHPEIPALYKSNEGLKRVPKANNSESYIDLYGGSGGENFHREFWRHIAQKIQ